MALTTYAGLKASIADWLNRSDLTNQIDDFIDSNISFPTLIYDLINNKTKKTKLCLKN